MLLISSFVMILIAGVLLWLYQLIVDCSTLLQCYFYLYIHVFFFSYIFCDVASRYLCMASLSVLSFPLFTWWRRSLIISFLVTHFCTFVAIWYLLMILYRILIRYWQNFCYSSQWESVNNDKKWTLKKALHVHNPS